MITRDQDAAAIHSMLDAYPSANLVCVMRDGSPLAQTVDDQLRGGASIVIAPKEWNRLGRAIVWLAAKTFPARLSGVDPLSSTFGFRLDAVDLNRLEPDGNALLLEVLVSHPGLTVVSLAGPRELEVLRPIDGLRFCVHLADLRLRTSRLWGGLSRGVAMARYDPEVLT
ncbi:MAG: hypothetical protein R2706_10475 [Acidimicrobiales bacterium]